MLRHQQAASFQRRHSRRRRSRRQHSDSMLNAPAGGRQARDTGARQWRFDGARRLSGRDFEVCDLETCRNDCTQECDVVLPVRKISTHPGAGSRSIKNHIPRNLCHFEPCRRFVPSGNAAGRRFVPGGKSSFQPGCRYGRSLPRSCHGALARADAGSTVGRPLTRRRTRRQDKNLGHAPERARLEPTRR